MAGVIHGKSVVTGTTSGSWTRGLSAYDLAVKYLGYDKDVVSWLKSLKAFSPVVGEITTTEDGIQFTLTDESGDHIINLRNGLDIGIDSTEVTEDGTVVTFSDGNQITIPNGVKGDAGDAIELMSDENGMILWRYVGSEEEWNELFDLGACVDQKLEEKFRTNPSVMVVDELPDPQDALEGVIYVIRVDDGEGEG